MKAGSQPHIAILGSHGIGKTHFIEFAYRILEEHKREIGIDKIYYVKGKKGFKESFLEENLYNSKIKTYIIENPEKKILVFFDDIDVIFKRYSEEMIEIFDLCAGCIIGTWDSHAWGNMKINSNFKIPKTEAIYINRLNDSYSHELLIKRIDDVSEKDFPKNIFPEFVIKKLSIIANGNPYGLISYAKRYLDYILDNNILEINSDKFKKFCDKINIQFIDDIKKILLESSEKHREIVSFIIENVEVSAEEVGKKFEMSRVGAMKSLKILRDKKVLESKTKDRTNYYYVPTEMTFDILDYLEKLKEINDNEKN